MHVVICSTSISSTAHYFTSNAVFAASGSDSSFNIAAFISMDLSCRWPPRLSRSIKHSTIVTARMCSWTSHILNTYTGSNLCCTAPDWLYSRNWYCKYVQKYIQKSCTRSTRYRKPHQISANVFNTLEIQVLLVLKDQLLLIPSRTNAHLSTTYITTEPAGCHFPPSETADFRKFYSSFLHVEGILTCYKSTSLKGNFTPGLRTDHFSLAVPSCCTNLILAASIYYIAQS